MLPEVEIEDHFFIGDIFSQALVVDVPLVALKVDLALMAAVVSDRTTVEVKVTLFVLPSLSDSR